MKTKGKAWQLIVTVLLIAAFVYTAFFGVAVKYGDVTTPYLKGAKDIRFGVDIKGGVNVTFVPSDGYDATDEQLEAAQLVIENRLVALNVTDYELYVDNNSDSLILEFPWQSGETNFDPGQSLYGYLLRSVYNQSVNYVNKHRHACSYRSYYQERIESIGYAYYDPDRNPVIEKLYSQDLRTSINEAIAALPAKCREVFSLSYLQGFSHREISEQMGIAQSTVENHIYLALRQLRAKLSKSELILLLFFIFLQNNSHPLG